MTLTGQVGVLTKHPGWYGRAVQLFTGSLAYHTVTAISETECVSAETPRVRQRPISYFADNGLEWTNVPMTDTERDVAVAFVRRQVGKSYAYLDIIFIIITTITRLAHTPMDHRPPHGRPAMVLLRTRRRGHGSRRTQPLPRATRMRCNTSRLPQRHP